MIEVQPYGQMSVYYRTGNFDSTASSSWTQAGQTWVLDSTWNARRFFINRTSRQIQFAIMNSASSPFEVREMVLCDPEIQEDR